MNKSNQKILVICGPTASGKTSLALKIAEFLPEVNILSADSRQVYKDLDIVTGKDIPRDLPESIKFFGVGIAKSDTNFNLSDFVEYSKKVISNSIKNKTNLIIVGGTGLYLKAITENLLDVHVPPNPALRSKLEALTVKALQEELMKMNPKKYKSLNHSDLFNPRRLIRAIEISSSKKRPLTSVISTEVEKSHSIKPNSPKFIWIGLSQDSETLKKKIHDRVIDRIAAGAVEEVSRLRHKISDTNLPIFSSLGVSQIIEFLEDRITLEELERKWTSAELDYARRQMVWFKKQKGIIWYDRSSVDQTVINKLINKLNEKTKKSSY